MVWLQGSYIFWPTIQVLEQRNILWFENYVNQENYEVQNFSIKTLQQSNKLDNKNTRHL